MFSFLTRASGGHVVVQQISTDWLHRHVVQLSGLQGAKRHLIVVFEDRPDVQLSVLSVQKYRISVHVALTGSPAHLQTAAVSAVTDVDVLYFTGNWGGKRHFQITAASSFFQPAGLKGSLHFYTYKDSLVSFNTETCWRVRVRVSQHVQNLHFMPYRQISRLYSPPKPSFICVQQRESENSQQS